MASYIQWRMERERTLLLRKQVQLASVTLLIAVAAVLVLLYQILF